MDTVLLVILFIVALVLIIVILLQRSEQGALGGLAGGSGGGNGFMSGRSKANLMTKITAVLVAIFFGLSLFMGYRASHKADNKEKILNAIKTSQTSLIVDKKIDNKTKATKKDDKVEKKSAPTPEVPK